MEEKKESAQILATLLCELEFATVLRRNPQGQFKTFSLIETQGSLLGVA